MSEKNFYQSFRIHPVGQGFFYTCTIKNQQQINFRMVFDCGSKTRGTGQEEVAVYRADSDYISKKILDLLVISHFDSDHVNHIDKLLAGGIKIKRLVMPFVSFDERLFLTLKLLSEHKGYKEEIDSTARLIIDPLWALADNLDDGFEGYIIVSASEPISPEDFTDDDRRDDNETRIAFNFPRRDKLTADSPNGIKIFAVKDSVKGKATDHTGKLVLMDFLFYRKSLGDKEAEFYEEVKRLFFDWKEIDASLENEALAETIYEKVKTINSSTRIIDIFKNAAKAVKITAGKGVDIFNLNTTALGMMHRNLDAIYDYAAGGHYDADMYYRYKNPSFHRIQKFLAGKSSRVVAPDYSTYQIYGCKYYLPDRYFDAFPNVLLTSDCFLLTESDVTEFVRKYQHYWSDFWLFQIPHHGSVKNSDATLHNNIPFESRCFINYGTKNIHKHPSDAVIRSLVANELSLRLIAVNEYQGFEFSLNIKLSAH